MKIINDLEVGEFYTVILEEKDRLNKHFCDEIIVECIASGTVIIKDTRANVNFSSGTLFMEVD